MALKLGKYNVCVLDLLTDSRTGRLSASKLWLHIANSIMSYIMLHSETVDWELLAVYGSVVGGSYVAVLFFKLRYSGATLPNSGGSEYVPDSELDGMAERGGTSESERTAKRPVRGSRKNTKGGKR